MSNINDPRIDALQPLVDRVRTDMTAKLTWGLDGKKHTIWDKLPLTRERLAAHLNGGPPRGAALMLPGSSSTSVGVFDLDSHKGEVPWARMIVVGAQIAETAEIVHGAQATVFRSGGGQGLHIYLMWEREQDAHSVRALMASILEVCGLRPGAGSLATGEVDVFPKRDAVDVGKFGNQVFLPLHTRGELLEMCDLSGILASAPAEHVTAGMWHMAPPVPIVAAPARERRAPSTDAPDLGRLRSALEWIADRVNSGEQVLTRNLWRDWIFAIHAESAGDESGRELAHEFSQSIPDYDEAEVDKIWDAAEVGRVDGITGASVTHLARSLGWADPRYAVDAGLAAFGVVVPDPVAPLPLPAFTRDGRGAILPTATNAVLAVRRPDLIGWRVGHDEFKDEITIAREDAPLGDGWRPMRDADLVDLRMSCERLGFKTVPKELVRDAVVKVCEENRFDSAQVWLHGLEGRGWDGVERVSRFFVEYFGCEDTPYSRAVGRYLWTAFAGRVLDPGCQVDMAPILEGDQGLRKSSAVAAMVPSHEFFVEVDFSAKEEDTSRRLRGALVGEIAELRGLHTKDEDAIKKFITRRWENWIPKFKEFATTFARRLVFIGTVNPKTAGFLADETGNRRWLPLHVERADVEGISRDRDRLWAEGARMWRARGVAWADAERLAAPEHERYMIADEWEGAIVEWLAGVETMAGDDETGDAKQRRGALPVTIPEIASGALGVALKDVGMMTQKRVGAVLRKLGYRKHNLRIGGQQGMRWVLPVLPVKK